MGANKRLIEQDCLANIPMVYARDFTGPISGSIIISPPLKLFVYFQYLSNVGKFFIP